MGQTPPLTPPLGCVYPQSMVHACSTCSTIFTSSFILALKREGEREGGREGGKDEGEWDGEGRKG